MMKTQTLYYDDSYMRRGEARVVAVHQLKDTGKTAIVLDRTIFYPGGGGQPADRGSIEGHELVDIQKIGIFPFPETDILHIIPFTERLKEGDAVELLLNWEQRIDYMQQHSGQHIISAAFWHMGGHATASVYFGQEQSSVEFDSPEISDEEIMRGSALANEAIAADLPIRARLIEAAEAKTLLLRRNIKVSGNIRIVEIAALSGISAEGLPLLRYSPFDLVGCGGLHLRHSAELQLIQHIRQERIRGRVRLYWKIGSRALRDYQSKTDICTQLGSMLSLPAGEIPVRIEQLQGEGVILRRQILELKQEAVHRKLGLLVERGFGKGKYPALCLSIEDAEMPLLRDAAKNLQRKGVARALLVGLNKDRIFWLILDGREEHIDFSLLEKQILFPLGAKGGGRPPIWQGSVNADSNAEIHAESLLESLRDFIDRPE